MSFGLPISAGALHQAILCKHSLTASRKFLDMPLEYNIVDSLTFFTCFPDDSNASDDDEALFTYRRYFSILTHLI